MSRSREVVNVIESGDLVVIVLIERNRVTFRGRAGLEPWVCERRRCSGATEPAGSGCTVMRIRSWDSARLRTR
jgi:hypothetical protein